MDLPKNDKHFDSVDEKDGLWSYCKLCIKIIMFSKGKPFAMVRWRQHKLGNGNHLKKLERKKVKQRAKDKYILN